MKAGSKLRMWVKKLYPLPVVGYLVRLGAALVRLPEAESYHAALLKQLDERLHAIERLHPIERLHAIGAGQSDSAGQTNYLVAKLATLLEELRARQAKAETEIRQQINDTSDALDFWLAEVLNKTTRQQASLRQLKDRTGQMEAELRKALADLREELSVRTGALQAARDETEGSQSREAE